jgi:peptidoglycan/xylan/chitin deacetylase (PgdA/CDA1 family)
MKALLKRGVVLGIGRAWTQQRSRERVVVLCYHSIHPTKSFASATPELFARHLDWLAESCHVVPLRAVAAGDTAAGRGGTRPTVAITFDDGYADNFEFAFPLLQARRIPATFFVTAGLADHDPRAVARMQQLRCSEYADVRPMEWTDLQTMHAAGMEIGAHTCTHPNLARLSRSAAADELGRSKAILEDRLGIPIRSMAFPFGKPGRHFTPETVALAVAAGYEHACAVLFRAVRPTDSRLTIPRFFVTRDDVGRLREKVLGAWDVIGAWQEHCPLWLARCVAPADFPA